MFCDLVGSTALAAQFDPEDLREVVHIYQKTCADVIARFDGYVAQYLGDGLLVYFGYPRAHEDDAQRAVRTALGILETMASVNGRLCQERGVRLAVRIGIHTGLVVIGRIGDSAREEQLALGEAPNVAARLQSLADPDTIVISASTRRLLRETFACEDLDTHALKGVSRPVRLYRVRAEISNQSPQETFVTGLSPFVGRENEQRLLLERWEKVKDGLGHVVLLSGEAGIGKSRLVEVLKMHVTSQPHNRWELRCSAYHQQSAFYPVIDLFQRVLHFGPDESPEERLPKLETALTQLGFPIQETAPLWAALLSLPLPDRYPSLGLNPLRQKQQTLEAIVAVLLILAARKPALVIVEDLHWIDPSTLELLNLIIDRAATAPILALFTFRPDFQPPWPNQAHFSPLTLNRFNPSETELMVGRMVGGKTLPPAVLQQVVAKTDGVPLFVEELTKMVLESGWLSEQADSYALTGTLPSLSIPTTLQDSLMARLDRLAGVKVVAQLASMLGRSFPQALLQAVCGLPEATLRYGLDQLVNAELLYEGNLAPHKTYAFKHALIQDAAYQSLLKSTRQQYHGRIAEVLNDRFPEIVETQPELLAHHFTEGGLTTQAIVYWRRAGQYAVQRSANLEAIGHFTRGLELLPKVPDSLERSRQELDFQTSLGPPLMSSKGYAAPEVEHAYARARELCAEVGNSPQLYSVLWGLWLFHFVRAQLETAHDLGIQLLSLAQRVDDAEMLLEAYRAVGTTLCFMGEPATARGHLERGLELYDSERHRSHAFRYGQDPGVTCLSYLAWVLWLQGYPDKALQRGLEAVSLAQRLAHPFTVAFALNWVAWLHRFRREPEETRKKAELVIVTSREQGFPQRVATGRMLLGWARSQQEQGPDGIVEMRQGLEAFGATGAKIGLPHYLALLAETYVERGRTDEALMGLAEALQAVNVSGDALYHAELHRLRGESMLRQASTDCEAAFHTALSVARRQGAKSLELRIAMSLYRLWQTQGKREGARQLLVETYNWFTEGFATADLKEARALLERE